MAFLLFVSAALAKTSAALWAEVRYDSNICFLSDYELGLFRSCCDDFLITTSDDAVLRAGGWVEWRGRFRGLYARLRASGFGAFFVENKAKSYGKLSAYAELGRGVWRVRLFGSFVPYYASRAYRDDETKAVQWASYCSVLGGVRLRLRLAPGLFFGVRAAQRLARYNEFFPEYDSVRRSFGAFVARWGITDIELGYEYAASDARGYDEACETKDSSDESDISYVQDRFYVTLGRELGAFELGAELYASHRVYTSRKPLWVDPLHVGRDEWRVSFAPWAKFSLGGGFWLRAQWRVTSRSAKSPCNPDVAKLRSYERHIVFLRVGRDF